MPHISVVIPTYKRADLLARLLDALLRQDLAGSDFEVIVCDDAASEETREQMNRRASAAGPLAPALRYLPITATRGPAAARNAGWRDARAPILAFTDDDTIPAPGWLRAGLAAFADDTVAAAAGRVVVPLPANLTDYERDAANLAKAGFVTANCFVRRDALAAVGGFDERFGVAWREDSDLAFTLERRGFHVVEAPAAVVEHPVRPARWGVSLGQQRKSLYNALLYKKHPARYRRSIQRTPPLRYFGIAGAALAAAASLALGKRRTAAAAGLIWLCLTGELCALRLRGTSRAPAHVAEMAVTSALIPWLAIYWRLRGALRFRVLFF